MTIQIKQQLVGENATLRFAGQFARGFMGGCYAYLSGDLGAGKTTFVRGLLQNLGITGKIKSPTYTIVEPYAVKNLRIYHFDLYRLQQADELAYLGIEEYFTPASICLIEWPEHGGRFLPPPDLYYHFVYCDSAREVTITATTGRGEKILQALQDTLC